MVDIAMCKGGECPLKKECYRYMAIPNDMRQSYFTEPPFKDDKCEYFENIDGSRKVRNDK